MYEMFQGMWRACINASDDETDQTNAKMSEYCSVTHTHTHTHDILI